MNKLHPGQASENRIHFGRCILIRLMGVVMPLMIVATSVRGQGYADASISSYRRELDSFRADFGGTQTLPDVAFFLFGMGKRTKLLYQSGKLIDSVGRNVLHEWKVAKETILPPEYAVELTTTDGKQVRIFEDEQAVWINEGKAMQAIEGTRHGIHLPSFDQYRYPLVMRVLHQELLINVVDGKPLPNYFVYSKPWHRDGAMMAMCLKASGNLDEIKDWILGLKDPYDRNNAGEAEADNLGQALFLISLVSDKNHPMVARVMDELHRLEARSPDGKYIKGRSDFSEHPVYQTKWAKWGLSSLGLKDEYSIPHVADSYSALFWMDYKETYVAGKDAADRKAYPYLDWAGDHFHGKKGGPISNRDYPLTWEKNASQAKYTGMEIISDQFVKQRLSVPHTWHAAEVFLYLMEQKKAGG